ncbi:MAG: two-component regulator propeller domain-containing protein [Chitinophagales bacterium]
MKSKLFFGFLCSLFALHLWAQDYKIEHLSLEDGLSQSIVYSITQDHKGFMWFGTQDGLNRYDGYSFKVYKPQPFDSTSLRHNSITAVLTDKNGQLWVGTAWGGLHLYDPIQDHFRRFCHKPKDSTSLSSQRIVGLQETNKGIWISTANGFNLMEVEGTNAQNYKVKFQRFLYEPNQERGESVGFVQALYEDHKGDVWLAVENSLLKYEFSKGTTLKDASVVSFEFEEQNPKSISSSYITGFAEDQQGNFWMATLEGLNRYVEESDSFERFFHEKNNPNSLSSNRIKSIICASNGDLWLGTGDKGVSRIKASSLTAKDEAAKELVFEHYTADNKDNPLSINYVETVFEDQWNEGVIWVGTMVGGLNKLIPITKRFKTMNLKESPYNEWIGSSAVFCTFKDQKERIWMGTEEGILVYNLQNEQHQILSANEKSPHALKGNFCTALVNDQSDNLWIGATHGLYKIFEPKPNQFQLKRYQPSEDCGDQSASSVYAAPNGLLYIGTWSGMSVFDPIKDEMLSCPIILDTLTFESKGYKISDFLQDDKGNLWIATLQGLILIEDFERAWRNCEIHPNLKVFHHNENDSSSLWDSYIADLQQDDAGDIWAATSSGIVKVILKDDKLTFEALTEKDGLANNMVYGMVKDPKTGDFWLSSNGGITKFNPIQKTFDNYTIQDGLQSNEFNGGAFTRAEDGEMVFGGINGISRFYPEEIQYDTIPPRIWITSLTYDKDKKLNLLYQPNQTIELPYAKRHFSLDFLAIDYANPNENQYAYRLDGLHDEWISAGTNRQVNFSDLSPGDYTFRVKACNGDGVWTEKSAAIQIAILPPFWMTPWFYGLIALFILAALWYFHQSSVKRKIEKVVEIEKIRKNAAADFHDELGHKLTVISLFSEIVKDKLTGKVDEEVSPHLEKVIKTSNELYFSMKDLLWALDPSKDSIYDLAIMLKDFGDELFDKTGVNFHSEGIRPLLKTRKLPMHYKRHIVLIFKEAMNNTLKHADCNNTLLAFDYNGNGHLAISFKDDGQGFEIPKVNEGNGLLNIKDRAERINADLVIQPENEGTAVLLECDLDAEVKNYF